MDMFKPIFKPEPVQKKPVQWVSHNKVLVGSGDGGNKKPHARNPNFDSEETRLLIQLWGDPQVQRTLITIHKKHPVIAKIAERMRSHGYNRSTEEINTRIKNLKCLYNRIKKDLDSGLLNEPSWKHFSAMDEILSRPIFGNSNKVAGSSKIVISPMPTSTNSSPPPLEGPFSTSPFHIKEEDLSDMLSDDNEESMEFEGSELRPEDLLSVVDDDESEIQVKDEPMDTESSVKLVSDKETSDSTVADSSTDPGKKDSPNPTTTSSANPLMTKNIINYSNDTLSIASVVSGTSSLSQAQSIPKTSLQSNNKISLVPTKLLLKPQAVGSFKPSAPTIMYSSVPTSTVAVSSNTQSSSIPMKVVFVNALNNNATAQNSPHKSHQITINNKQITQLQQQTQNPAFITNKFIAANTNQKVQIVNSRFNSVPKVTTTVSNGESNSKGSKGLLGSKLPVIRNLLTNIVEIENQRLEIEKQRFEYEKSVGNELLSMLRTFIGAQSTNVNNHQEVNESTEESCE